MTKNHNPESDLPTELARPARRALVETGYTRLEQLTMVSEDEVLKLRGMGPKALEQLRRALAARGLLFARASGEDDEHAVRELVETWFTASKAGDLPTVSR
jgi:hypothetical protein